MKFTTVTSVSGIYDVATRFSVDYRKTKRKS